MNIVPLREGVLENIWPKFLLHDAVVTRYWDRIYGEYPEFQFALVDGGEIVAEGNSIPVHGRPAQFRDALLGVFERGGEPDRLCALAVMIAPSHRGRGLSRIMLEHMRGLSALLGGELVAPVRPTLKAEHPHVPIEEYAAWRREDGAHADPWLRTHERVGGQITGTADEAMLVEGSLDDWRSWTGVAFDHDGEYVVAGALVPVTMHDGRGVYREPCVWVEHALKRA